METPMDPLFAGVGVALVTLFDAERRVDVPATADLAVGLVESGMRGVVVAGTTGEAASLSAPERIALVTAVRAALPGGVPVIAGTGAATGRQAAAYTREAVDAGADGVLVLSPPAVDDCRPYFDEVVAAAGAAPVLAYHYPAASLPGIPVETLAALPVAGAKDSSGDAERITREVAGLGPRPVYAGSSALLLHAGAVGAHGAILTLANAEPELCVRAFDGDAAAQRDLMTAHLVGTRDLPAGIKSLVARRFGTAEHARVGR